jgi:hypothetical protein
MKIIIGRPQDWIDRSKARTAKIWFYDVEALYDAIPEVCEEMGIDYEVRHLTPHTRINDSKNIFLGHHTYGNDKNMWHIKKGYVPGYMYWDKRGYSGWSEAVSKYDPNKEYGDILWNTHHLMQAYIDKNESKIKQPSSAKVPEKPYVLVLGQRPHDTVSKHAYIDTGKLAGLVNKVYKDSGYAVFTKPHPMSLKTRFPGALVQGSMHHLIASAEAIYTVNSGSGFESLFHAKTVFTSGDSDYSPVTINVKTEEDIKNTICRRVDPGKIIHYLHYCFNEHFVNCYDKESIRRKLQRCVDEYEV